MRPLFDIGDDVMAFVALLDEAPDGEVTPEAAVALDGWFAELVAGEQGAKLDSYLNAILTFDVGAEAMRKEGERYIRGAQVKANHAARLRGRLLDYLRTTGQTKAVTASGRTVSVQVSGGVAPLVIDDAVDLKTVEPRFLKVRADIDRDAVRAALLAGEGVGWARVGERGVHLRVRPA